jgi:hypothetical protein
VKFTIFRKRQRFVYKRPSGDAAGISEGLCIMPPILHKTVKLQPLPIFPAPEKLRVSHNRMPKTVTDEKSKGYLLARNGL